MSSDRPIKLARADSEPSTPAAEGAFWGAKIDSEVNQSGIYTHFLEVTPDLAKLWLARNQGNRRPSASIIARYARDMANGQWMLSSQAISFSAAGRLINGQHRLQACLHAGVPFRSLVVFGLDEISFQNEDTAKKRSRKDRLGLQQEERATVLSAAIGWLHAYRSGGFRRNSSRNEGPTPAEERDLLARHPGLRKSVGVVSGKAYESVGWPGLLACLHHLLSEQDATLAAAFFDGLATGEMLTHTDPVYQLRKRLQENRTSQRKLSRLEVPALIIKAWNHTREGRSIQQLSWRPSTEPFPEIR